MSQTRSSHHTRHFARRIESVSESSIFRVNSRAKALAQQGREILRLDAGEPDFDTPGPIVEAAKRALDEGYTRYTPIDGLPQLKQAIRDKFARENNLEYGTDEVMETCGAKQALFSACMCLLESDDEIIIPTPYWGTYPAIAGITGARIVYAPTCQEAGFVLQPEVLERCLSPRTRVLLLNTPNNPTGQVYSRDSLVALADVLLKYPDVVVVSDDIYEHLRFSDEPYTNIVNACPALKDRTVVVNGVSKAYAMTGWRVGFAAGPEDIIDRMQRLQGQTNSHTAAVSQVAAQAALASGLEEVHSMADTYARRAAQVHEGLATIRDLSFVSPRGSFYCLPDFSTIIETLDDVDNDQQFADWLLEELGIAMIPGSAFAAPGHMRLSFAADSQTLEKALSALQRAFG